LATNFSQSAEVAPAGSQKEKDISGIFAYAVRRNVSGDGLFLLVSEFTNYIFYIKIIFAFIAEQDKHTGVCGWASTLHSQSEELMFGTSKKLHCN
jgi:hypothetical protein